MLEIKNKKFYLNGEEFHIYSGAMHYFRIPEEYWYDRLLKLKASGLNTVETYVPWNYHEPRKNQFDFKGMLNIEKFVKTAQDLGLADGSYTAEVAFSGGSGKSHIESPVTLTVKDGAVTAAVVWSSSKYDYMIVDGERCDVLTTEPGSTFEIPVAAFDTDLTVIGDTTAMSTPHEIEYTLNFASATLTPAG